MIRKHPNGSDFHFRILVEALPDRTYRATCLDWDIVSEEPTEKKAVEQLFRLMDVQWQAAIEHGASDSVWHPAPQEFWQKYYSSLPAKSIPKPKKFSDIAYAHA